jgi:hypothetical protein
VLTDECNSLSACEPHSQPRPMADARGRGPFEVRGRLSRLGTHPAKDATVCTPSAPSALRVPHRAHRRILYLSSALYAQPGCSRSEMPSLCPTQTLSPLLSAICRHDHLCTCATQRPCRRDVYARRRCVPTHACLRISRSPRRSPRTQPHTPPSGSLCDAQCVPLGVVACASSMLHVRRPTHTAP